MSEKQEPVMVRKRLVGGRQTVFGYQFYCYRLWGVG